jgi:DNA-nicking Smr family endonuclease
MSKRRPTPPVEADDAALFREAIGEVRRIEVDDAAIGKPPPAPAARMRREDEAAALRESRHLPASAEAFALGEPLAYRRDEVAPRTLRRLAAGDYAVQDEVDLHHLPAPEAEKLLKAFLTHARAERHACVRVIHGKGLRSEAGPVLKAMVDGVLRHRGDVLAFASAPPAQGGTGAVLVLLGKVRREP